MGTQVSGMMPELSTKTVFVFCSSEGKLGGGERTSKEIKSAISLQWVSRRGWLGTLLTRGMAVIIWWFWSAGPSASLVRSHWSRLAHRSMVELGWAGSVVLVRAGLVRVGLRAPSSTPGQWVRPAGAWEGWVVVSLVLLNRVHL